MNALRCPICRTALHREGKSAYCQKGHCFDYAKDGYLNLLPGSHKSNTGDSRTMALSRRAFLERGYFAPLRDGLLQYLQKSCCGGAALDICCGEGYYTQVLAHEDRDVYAFDLSKEMVRLAAKRDKANCFVANIAAIPLRNCVIQTAIHLFAPFHDGEFSRIMHPNGMLLTVVPGAKHLMGMKQVLYDAPYENDEKPPEAPSFHIVDTYKIEKTAVIQAKEDIAALVRMTPYGVHSPREGLERLQALDTLTTGLSFVVYVMKKN